MLKIGELKVGNRVIYTDSSKYGIAANNPVWGGRYGNIVGTVVELKDAVVIVEWDNGKSNNYAPKYLDFADESLAAKAKEKVDKLYDVIKPYEKYIGLVALAMVIDYFVLGGKFTNKFKKLAESVISKIVGTLDKIIDRILPE
jgi:hypothetical protein